MSSFIVACVTFTVAVASFFAFAHSPKPGTRPEYTESRLPVRFGSFSSILEWYFVYELILF